MADEILRIGLDASGSVKGAELHASAMNKAASATENAGKKMVASERQTLAEYQRIYVERVKAAQEGAKREVEAAQRASRDKMRYATSVSEINAVRQHFQERLAIIKGAYQQEVLAAQQAHLAATQGMRPAVAGLDDVAKSATRARAGLGSMREPLTTLVASFLPLNRATLAATSALGVFAAGAGTVIAITAGLAAIGFAWNRLTKEMRDAKERANEAAESIQKAYDARRYGAFNGAAQNLGIALGEKERARLALEEAKRGRTITTAQQGTVTVISQAEIARAQKAYDDLSEVVRKGESEITAIRLEEEKKRDNVADTAAAKALELARKMEDDLSKIAELAAEHWAIINGGGSLDMRDFAMPGQKGKKFEAGTGVKDPSIPTATDDAVKALQEFAKKVREVWGAVPAGGKPVTTPAQTPWEQTWGGMRGVGAGIAASAGSQVLQEVIGAAQKGLTNLINSIVGLGDASNKTSRELRRSQMDFRMRVTEFGSSADPEFHSAENQIRREQARLTSEAMALFGMNSKEFEELNRQISAAAEAHIAAAKAAEAAAKAEAELAAAREKARQLADFTGNLLGLEAQNAQRAGGSEYQTALRASMEFNTAKQLASAKELLDSGTITQELFDRLKDALGVQLKNALEDAEKAAQAAARAVAEAKASFIDTLTLAEFAQMGDEAGSASLRANIQARDWIKQAKELFAGDELESTIKRINTWLEGELARINGGGSAVPPGILSAPESARVTETVRSVTGITATQANSLLNVSRSQLGVQQSMNLTLSRIERRLNAMSATGGVNLNDINTGLGRFADTDRRLNGDASV